MRRRSKEQAQRERALKAQKYSVFAERLQKKGRISCDGDCGLFFVDMDMALSRLSGHHVKLRKMGASYHREGIDDESNLSYLCFRCHEAKHQ